MKYPYRWAKSQLLVHEFQLHFFSNFSEAMYFSVLITRFLYLLTISQWPKIWKKPHWEKFPKIDIGHLYNTSFNAQVFHFSPTVL